MHFCKRSFVSVRVRVADTRAPARDTSGSAIDENPDVKISFRPAPRLHRSRAVTKSSNSLQFSTLVRVGQSILLAAVLAALALVAVAALKPEGRGDRTPRPGTERTAPRGSYDSIEELA